MTGLLSRTDSERSSAEGEAGRLTAGDPSTSLRYARDDTEAGRVTEISGWVVRARAAVPLALREVVLVGHERLIGEVIALARDEATIQVYEETEGVAPGHPLYATGGGIL